jgi:hypothetical protein
MPSVIMLSVAFSYCHAECHFAECRISYRHAECHFAECQYAECHGAETGFLIIR